MKNPTTPIASAISTSTTLPRDRVDAEGGEDQDAGVQDRRGGSAASSPTPGSAAGSAPAACTLPMYSDAISAHTSAGSLSNSCGPGWTLKIWNAASMTRRGRRGRDAQRQQRHQHAGERRVVGRLRTGHALDRALAELVRVLRAAASRRCSDRNVGISAPPAGSAPNGKPSAVPRSHGRHERRQSSRVMPATLPPDGERPPSAPCAQPRRDVQRLADREQRRPPRRRRRRRRRAAARRR